MSLENLVNSSLFRTPQCSRKRITLCIPASYLIYKNVYVKLFEYYEIDAKLYLRTLRHHRMHMKSSLYVQCSHMHIIQQCVVIIRNICRSYYKYIHTKVRDVSPVRLIVKFVLFSFRRENVLNICQNFIWNGVQQNMLLWKLICGRKISTQIISLSKMTENKYQPIECNYYRQKFTNTKFKTLFRTLLVGYSSHIVNIVSSVKVVIL